MKECKLPSGAILKILNIPFAEAKDLYQAILEEAKGLKFASDQDVGQLFKDLFCLGFSSKKVESALWKCLERCTYNDLKIDQKTFEPISARGDYSIVCIEVIQDVIAPFTKGLYVELPRLLSMIIGAQA